MMSKCEQCESEKIIGRNEAIKFIIERLEKFPENLNVKDVITLLKMVEI